MELALTKMVPQVEVGPTDRTRLRRLAADGFPLSYSYARSLRAEEKLLGPTKTANEIF